MSSYKPFQFWTEDFSFVHGDDKCGKDQYLEYLAGPGFGTIKSKAPEGRGVWRGWLSDLRVTGEGKERAVRCLEIMQRFAPDEHTGSTRKTYDITLGVTEAEPGRWLLNSLRYA